MLARALKSIPLGTQTFSKSFQQWPEGNAPLFLSHGRGGRVWDVDGNEYIDMVSGLLPVILGYCDPDVDAAIRRQLDRGISFSLATELEVELAERLIEIIPCAQSVRFGKNGTDATSAAVRLSRAATGRDHIIALGYHGWQDWYVGATTRHLGVPESVRALTRKIAWNDLDAIENEFRLNQDNVAAVVLEPMSAVPPAEGYLSAVKDLCHRHGALLIFDEVVTGFRFALGGAQEYFGVTPDLAAFGKALGNGMPISAVVGRADVMAYMEKVFFSGTFGGETLSLAASIAVIDKLRSKDVVARLWALGEDINRRLSVVISECGLDGAISLQGTPPWTIFGFSDQSDSSAAAIKTFFIQEMLEAGVLIASSHNLTLAHEAEVDALLDTYHEVLPRIASSLNAGDLDGKLSVPIIQPVFSPR